LEAKFSPGQGKGQGQGYGMLQIFLFLCILAQSGARDKRLLTENLHIHPFIYSFIVLIFFIIFFLSISQNHESGLVPSRPRGALWTCTSLTSRRPPLCGDAHPSPFPPFLPTPPPTDGAVCPLCWWRSPGATHTRPGDEGIGDWDWARRKMDKRVVKGSGRGGSQTPPLFGVGVGRTPPVPFPEVPASGRSTR